MMQDPAVMATMTNMMAQPGFLELAETMNPELRAVLNAQPGMRSMMRNPAMMQMMMSLANPGGLAGVPPAQQQQQQQQFPPFLFAPPTGAATAPAAGNAPAAAPPVDFNALLAMMGGMGGMGAGVAAPAVPPAELYATQLVQMEEMGLVNREQNIRALQMSGGNVNVAVDRIFSGQA